MILLAMILYCACALALQKLDLCLVTGAATLAAMPSLVLLKCSYCGRSLVVAWLFCRRLWQWLVEYYVRSSLPFSTAGQLLLMLKLRLTNVLWVSALCIVLYCGTHFQGETNCHRQLCKKLLVENAWTCRLFWDNAATIRTLTTLVAVFRFG